jgi:hypothetical protein
MPIHVPAVPEGETARSGGDFEPLPDNIWFTVKVLAAEAVTASTGTPGVKLDMEVTDGAYAKRRIFDRLWASPRSAAWFREKVSAFGVDLPPGEIEMDESILVGRRAAVMTQQESYTNAKGETKIEARPKAYDRIAGPDLPTGPDWRDELPEATPAGVADEDVPF